MPAGARGTLPSMALSFQQCERARRARDHRYDGRFFTAVKTTGIYCRPVCPAPQPKSRNVEYFDTSAQAAQQGYRPCLRCRPETAPHSPSWQGSVTTVRRAVRLIHDGELSDQSLASFAERLGVSDRHLRRLFDTHVGVSPQAYALNHRLLFAKQLLSETRLPVLDVAVASGFSSRRRFNDAFQRQFALTPSQLRKPSAARHPGIVVKLRYRPPFDFQGMLSFLSARTLEGVEGVEDGTYYRSFTWEEQQGWFSLTQDSKENALLATVHCSEPRAYLPVVQRIRQVFDLDASPIEIHRALRKDAHLKPRLKRIPGLRLPGIWSEFEAIIRAIVGQQISVQAARTILSRLCDRFGQPLVGAAQSAQPLAGALSLRCTFPSPRALASADLKGMGLTRARARWVRGAAEAYAGGFEAGAGDLDSRVKKLCSLPGIGPWSAHYTCIRALQEPDAFPASDLGLYRALGLEKGTPKQTEAMAEAWRPWRAYAVMCLWHSLGD